MYSGGWSGLASRCDRSGLAEGASGFGTPAAVAGPLLGILGFPVFSQGGGIAYLAGPTGGYLIGYLPAALLAGAFSRRGTGSVYGIAAGLLAGSAAIYVCGVPFLAVVLGLDFRAALRAGLLPFIPGDILKIAAGTAVFMTVRRYRPELIPILAARHEEGDADT